MHVAARIKFDRDLKEAVDINVKGTRRVVQLCRQLPLLKVKSFHISIRRICFVWLNALCVPTSPPQKKNFWKAKVYFLSLYF